MGALAVTILISAGLLVGLAVQYLTRPRSKIDWLFVAVATSLGAFVGSELLNVDVFNTLRPDYTIDGLAIVPAVLVGLTFGLIADATVRYISTPDTA